MALEIGLMRLVGIMFPGTGQLVLSAWCLGILNSNRRFFLSYVAPVFWNVAIMAALVTYGSLAAQDGGARLAVVVAWGVVIGGGLQFLVQLPPVLRLARPLRLSLDVIFAPVRQVLHNFTPALLARGVVQLSAYVDQVLSSYLGASAVAAIAYSQTLAMLPVSLFGIAISTAELTEMSRSTGDSEAVTAKVRERLERGLRRISFFVVPSGIAFLALGDHVVGTVFQTGKFTARDTVDVWWILAGSAVGLLASTQSRLCATTFWALGDTRRPALVAFARVLLTGGFGYAVTFPLRERFGWSPVLAAAALMASAGVAGWIEFTALRSLLQRRIGAFHAGTGSYLRCVLAAGLGAAGARAVSHWLPPFPPAAAGFLVLGTFGALYLMLTRAFGVEEAALLLRRFSSRFRGGGASSP